MKIMICIGSSCHIKGSRQVVELMQNAVREHHLEDHVIFHGKQSGEPLKALMRQSFVGIDVLGGHRKDYPVSSSLKSREYCANIMRLLKLPSEVQQMVVDKKLTMSHVRPLLSLRDEDQIYEAAQQVLKQKMSVREVEAYVHNLSGTEVKPQKKKIHTEKDPWIRDLENRMQQKLSTGVNVSKKSITISYTDTEDLNRILDLLGCIEESNM